MDLVAGGYLSSGFNLDDFWGDIVVTGQWGDMGWYFDWVPYTDGGSGGSGGGGTVQDPSHQQIEDANDNTCVHVAPAGVDINHLNDMAKYLGHQLANLSAADDNEWGAFIYMASNGQLYEGDPFTAGHHDDVNGATFNLPAGAIIVGYIHTHPESDGEDERLLSGPDRSFIRDLISGGRADPNMVAYINTADDTVGGAKTYAYDSQHRNNPNAGCTL
jgi:hypothetical protein